MPRAWPSSWMVVSARQGCRPGSSGSEPGLMKTRIGSRSSWLATSMSRSVNAGALGRERAGEPEPLELVVRAGAPHDDVRGGGVAHQRSPRTPRRGRPTPTRRWRAAMCAGSSKASSTHTRTGSWSWLQWKLMYRVPGPGSRASRSATRRDRRAAGAAMSPQASAESAPRPAARQRVKRLIGSPGPGPRTARPGSRSAPARIRAGPARRW